MAEEAEQPRIHELFGRMKAYGASDLHIKAGSAPHFRVDGQLRRMKSPALGEEQIDALVAEWLGKDRLAAAKGEGQMDLGYEFEGGRMRVALFTQRGRLSLVARRVESKIPDRGQLHLPEVMERFIDFNQGMVLLCGMTGMGKSTTLAMLIESLNAKQAKHILTFEDPIEFTYEDKQSVVNQREYGLDFQNWHQALTTGVRSDPDVILIGEMRDHETFQLALNASETGHLVFSSMHTSGCAATVPRILDLFPLAQHEAIRRSVARNLKAVACQRLVPSSAEGVGRVPVCEIMLMNPPIRKAIEEGDDLRIGDLIMEGEQEGMQSWTRAFANLVEEGLVEKRVAREYAPSREALDRVLMGIDLRSSSLG